MKNLMRFKCARHTDELGIPGMQAGLLGFGSALITGQYFGFYTLTEFGKPQKKDFWKKTDVLQNTWREWNPLNGLLHKPLITSELNNIHPHPKSRVI